MRQQDQTNNGKERGRKKVQETEKTFNKTRRTIKIYELEIKHTKEKKNCGQQKDQETICCTNRMDQQP